MSHGPGFGNHLTSLGRTVFRNNRIDEICPEKPRANSSGFLVSLPDNEAMHVPSPSVFAHRLTSLGRTVFRHNRIEAICPEKPVPTSRPSTLSSLPCRSFPSELSPSYFPQFPFRPPFHRFRVAPSPRTSPQAISHGFLSVHPLVASVLEAQLCAAQLFPPSLRSSPPAISTCWTHRNNRIHGICPENPVPKALHFSVAPSLRSSPPAISTLPTQLSPSYFHVLDPQFFRTIALM